MIRRKLPGYESTKSCLQFCHHYVGKRRGKHKAHLSIGCWVIGLPLGAYLCFKLNLGAVGMWAGLCLALVLTGSVLLLVWRRMIRQFLSSVSSRAGLVLSNK